MLDSIHKYCKVGLVHFMAYPSTMKGEGHIYDTVRKISIDDYFDAIEITHIKDLGERQKVKKILDTAHLDVSYGGQPRLLTTGRNINDLDEAKRLVALDLLLDSVVEAYEMGCCNFAFLSGKYSEETKEESYQQLVKSTSMLCEWAGRKGNMKIALEVFDYDIDKKSLIGPVALAKRFAEEMTIKYDNFGLMVDLSHIPMIHETIEENLLPIQQYIIHAHMGNTVIKDTSFAAYGDLHPRFGFLNSENDVDELVAYLKTLFMIGYLNEKNRRFLSFEVKPWGDEDPDVIVANAKRVLNLAWARV